MVNRDRWRERIWVREEINSFHSDRLNLLFRLVVGTVNMQLNVKPEKFSWAFVVFRGLQG